MSVVAVMSIVSLGCSASVLVGPGEDQEGGLPASGLITAKQAAGVIVGSQGDEDFVLLDIRIGGHNTQFSHVRT